MPISHPFRIDSTGRTARPTDVRAEIRELIELVLFTRPGERPMRPTFGSGAHELVFAPLSQEMAAIVQHTVRGALQQWLGSVIEVQDVTVQAGDAELTVQVTYARRIDGTPEVATLTRSL